MISEEELVTALAELKGQPKEMVRCLFQYFPTEKEYTLNGYVRLLEDIMLIEDFDTENIGLLEGKTEV